MCSDVRSKTGLQEKIFLTQNTSLAGFFGSKSREDNKEAKCSARKTCLVMDEVDGMSGGDRGGMAELIAIIKASKIPIICIANDYYDRKISSLKTHCYDLRFAKPPKPLVVKRLTEIAKEEGFVIPNPQAIEKLYETGGECVVMMRSELYETGGECVVIPRSEFSMMPKLSL